MNTLAASSLLFGILALVAAAWLSYSFSRPESRLYFLDHPNERSLHARPTPRTGGIGILVAVYLAGIASAVYHGFSDIELLWLAGLGAVIGTISFADDRYCLPLAYRLAAHVVAGALLVYAVHRSSAPEVLPGLVLGIPQLLLDFFAVLFVVWMINLYNFMDGMDGFAGGMGVFGFGTFAVLGWWAGHEAFMALSLIVAAASGGFLLFNFPPARIFMGDAGSTALGFVAAALILWARRDGIFPAWIGLLIFSPFIVDASVTLLRRVLRGERFWQAHKTHYYQRLVQAGWSHRRTALWGYVLMAACSASALLGLQARPSIQSAIIAFWVGAYGLMMYVVTYLEGRARNSA